MFNTEILKKYLSGIKDISDMEVPNLSFSDYIAAIISFCSTYAGGKYLYLLPGDKHDGRLIGIIFIGCVVFIVFWLVSAINCANLKSIKKLNTKVEVFFHLRKYKKSLDKATPEYLVTNYLKFKKEEADGLLNGLKTATKTELEKLNEAVSALSKLKDVPDFVQTMSPKLQTSINTLNGQLEEADRKYNLVIQELEYLKEQWSQWVSLTSIEAISNEVLNSAELIERNRLILAKFDVIYNDFAQFNDESLRMIQCRGNAENEMALLLN